MLVIKTIHSWFERVYGPQGYIIYFISQEEAKELIHDACTYLIRDRDGFKQGATIGYDGLELVCIIWRIHQQGQRVSKTNFEATFRVAFGDPDLYKRLAKFLAIHDSVQDHRDLHRSAASAVEEGQATARNPAPESRDLRTGDGAASRYVELGIIHRSSLAPGYLSRLQRRISRRA